MKSPLFNETRWTKRFPPYAKLPKQRLALKFHPFPKPKNRPRAHSLIKFHDEAILWVTARIPCPITFQLLGGKRTIIDQRWTETKEKKWKNIEKKQLEKK